MKWDKNKPMVPVDQTGNMMDYAPTSYDYKPPSFTWEEFLPQEMELSLEKFERGRSSVTYWWRAQNGHRYPMFLTDLEDLILNSVIQKGRVKGTFKAVKRGRSYGIARAS